MSSLFEIIELPNGDIALQKSDGDGEPLVKITFSEEASYFLRDGRFQVAKAMIEAGVAEVNDLGAEFEAEDVSASKAPKASTRTIH